MENCSIFFILPHGFGFFFIGTQVREVKGGKGKVRRGVGSLNLKKLWPLSQSNLLTIERYGVNLRLQVHFRNLFQRWLRRSYRYITRDSMLLGEIKARNRCSLLAEGGT